MCADPASGHIRTGEMWATAGRILGSIDYLGSWTRRKGSEEEHPLATLELDHNGPNANGQYQQGGRDGGQGGLTART